MTKTLKTIGRYAAEKGMNERILRSAVAYLGDKFPPDSQHLGGNGKVFKSWYFTDEQAAAVQSVYDMMLDPEWAMERIRQGQQKGAETRAFLTKKRHNGRSGPVIFEIIMKRLDGMAAQLDEIEKRQNAIALQIQEIDQRLGAKP